MPKSVVEPGRKEVGFILNSSVTMGRIKHMEHLECGGTRTVEPLTAILHMDDEKGRCVTEAKL